MTELREFGQMPKTGEAIAKAVAEAGSIALGVDKRHEQDQVAELLGRLPSSLGIVAVVKYFDEAPHMRLVLRSAADPEA